MWVFESRTRSIDEHEMRVYSGYDMREDEARRYTTLQCRSRLDDEVSRSPARPSIPLSSRVHFNTGRLRHAAELRNPHSRGRTDGRRKPASLPPSEETRSAQESIEQAVTGQARPLVSPGHRSRVFKRFPSSVCSLAGSKSPHVKGISLFGLIGMINDYVGIYLTPGFDYLALSAQFIPQVTWVNSTVHLFIFDP